MLARDYDTVAEPPHGKARLTATKKAKKGARGKSSRSEAEGVSASDITLKSDDGGKYKVGDPQLRMKSGNVSRHASGITVHASTTDLVVMYDGEVQFGAPLTATDRCSGIGGGEFHVHFRAPPTPTDVGKRDNCLAEMCARTTELKVVVGGHWTDDMAKRALAPLFEPRAAPPAAPPAAALAGGTSAAAAQSPKRATTRESKRNRSPNDGLAPKYAY